MNDEFQRWREQEDFKRFIRSENDRMEAKRNQNNHSSSGDIVPALVFMALMGLYYILKFIIMGLIIGVPIVAYFLPTIIGFWRENSRRWKVLGLQLLIAVMIACLLFASFPTEFIRLVNAGIIMLLATSIVGSIILLFEEEGTPKQQGLLEPHEWRQYSSARIEFEKHLERDYPRR